MTAAETAPPSTPEHEDGFLRDPLIDNDEGFDPDGPDRIQCGESV